MTIDNKSRQCNLVLQKQIEHGNLKLLHARSDLVHVNHHSETCTRQQKI